MALDGAAILTEQQQDKAFQRFVTFRGAFRCLHELRISGFNLFACVGVRQFGRHHPVPVVALRAFRSNITHKLRLLSRVPFLMLYVHGPDHCNLVAIVRGADVAASGGRGER